MAKITRKNMKIFGSSSGLDQISVFGSLYASAPAYTTDPETIQSLSNYLSGWFNAAIGGNSPTIEDMNALFYLYAYQLSYLMQEGVAEWNSETTYYIGSIVNDGVGNLYISIADNNLNHAITNTSYWLTLTYAYGTSIKSLSSAGYTILQNDGFSNFEFSTGASDQTITLCAAADSKGRPFTFVKTDNGAGRLIIQRAGSDTIGNGWTQRILVNQGDSMSLLSDGGTNFLVTKHPNTTLVYNNSGVAVTAQAAGTQKNIFGAASGLGISVPPGIWRASAMAQLVANAGTATPAGNGLCSICISSTQDTGNAVNAGDDGIQFQSFLTNPQIAANVPMMALVIADTKFTVNSTTTYYLNGFHGYAGNVPSWYASLKFECVG